MAEPGGIEGFVRSHLRGFSGYSASTSPDTLEGKVDVSPDNIVKMNANENPYGCSPRVLQALAENTRYHIYPDNGQLKLRETLSGYAGVPAVRIVAGHGSNTLIDYVTRLFVGPGDEVITCNPTFDLYRFSTQLYGGTVQNVSRGEDFAVDAGAVKAAVNPRTKLIFLATPNNPTGNAMPPPDILEIIETGVPVVVDEAYYEFHGETVMPYVEKYGNLMVLRSFSKWAGLAGLRVGYGVFPPRIADYLLATKIPHNVSVASEIAVRESLADIDWLKSRVAAIVVERERLYRELQEIPYLRPYPSRANFVYCDLRRGDANELHGALQKKGILVRNFQTAIRISAGRPEHTDILLQALREIGL